jgi:hypothetical protein
MRSRDWLLDRGPMFLARVACVMLLGMIVFFGVQAIAQPFPPPVDPAASSPVLFSIDPNGIMAQLLKLAEVALLGIGAFVAKRFSTFLAGKTQQNAAAKVGFTLWTKIQAIANHVEVELKPQFDKDMEDGKLTADEAKGLKTAALDIIKRDCAAEISQLPTLFGLSSDSAVGTFVSGLLEQAVNLIGKTAMGQAINKAIGDAPAAITETVTTTTKATATAAPAAPKPAAAPSPS